MQASCQIFGVRDKTIGKINEGVLLNITHNRSWIRLLPPIETFLFPLCTAPLPCCTPISPVWILPWHWSLSMARRYTWDCWGQTDHARQMFLHLLANLFWYGYLPLPHSSGIDTSTSGWWTFDGAAWILWSSCYAKHRLLLCPPPSIFLTCLEDTPDFQPHRNIPATRTLSSKVKFFVSDMVLEYFWWQNSITSLWERKYNEAWLANSGFFCKLNPIVLHWKAVEVSTG